MKHLSRREFRELMGLTVASIFFSAAATYDSTRMYEKDVTEYKAGQISDKPQLSDYGPFGEKYWQKLFTFDM